MADELNFQIPPQGYDSYLRNIIPEELGVLAGAFGISMQQIKNIENLDPQAFAKVVYSLETNNGLPLTNGTNVPTNTFVVDAALSKVALGSGLYGTYTHSDFIGSMTALPYPLQDVYNGIKELQTTNLENIYKELWQLSIYRTAAAEVEYEQDNTGLYIITGIKITNTGGGYNSAPSVTISNGATAVATVGSNSEDPATYTRLASLSLTSFGPAWPSIPTVTIAAPPSDAYGTVTTGWAARNARINALVNDANNEIENIATANAENFQRAKLLNANWNALGTALKIEQRARYTAIPPVPIPRDPFLALYPTALYNFVDALPELAANTMPHGPAQSLEMLADFCTPGGQSIVAMMRQERNQQRLAEIGIPLDNNIPNGLSVEDQRELMANGTKCGATDEGGVNADNGLSFPMPAFPNTEACDGTVLTIEKNTTYDNTESALRLYEDVKPGTIAPLLGNPDCSVVAGPQIPVGDSELLSTGIPSFLDLDLNVSIGNVIPDNLNINYISGILLPSQYDVNDAIDKVIECNCDCWVN